MYFGDYAPGATVQIPFNTFDSNDPSASVTITNFINTDVHIHKGADLTQRNNASGVTVDVDLDAITGSHLVTIDTSDNTVAGFFTAGEDYVVRIEGTTVDGATINAVIGTFSIDNRMYAGRMLATYLTSASSQTAYILAAGATDNDTYNNCFAVVSDIASGVQKCVGLVSDYDGATKKLTLDADPGIFTVAAGDNISISGVTQVMMTNAEVKTAVTSALTEYDSNAGVVSNTDLNLRSLAAASYATAAGQSATDTAINNTETTILADILQTAQVICRSDAAASADLTTKIADINTDEGSGAGDYTPTTDSLEANLANSMIFTKANEVDVNIKSINDVTVTGVGTSADLWRA
jgi:hypothetical protein